MKVGRKQSLKVESMKVGRKQSLKVESMKVGRKQSLKVELSKSRKVGEFGIINRNLALNHNRQCFSDFEIRIRIRI